MTISTLARSLGSRPFAIEQYLLALNAPGISRQGSVVPDHSVTRDRNRKIVGCAGTGNSAYRLG
jgi:hypothetical protein